MESLVKKTIYAPRIIKETTFRSEPRVNMTDDMVKVELAMSRRVWGKLKKVLDGLSA